MLLHAPTVGARRPPSTCASTTTACTFLEENTSDVAVARSSSRRDPGPVLQALESYRSSHRFSFLFLPGLTVLLPAAVLVGVVYQVLMDVCTIEVYRLILVGLCGLLLLSGCYYVFTFCKVRSRLLRNLTAAACVVLALGASYLTPYCQFVQEIAQREHCSLVRVLLAVSPLDYWNMRLEAGFVRRSVSGSTREAGGRSSSTGSQRPPSSSSSSWGESVLLPS